MRKTAPAILFSLWATFCISAVADTQSDPILLVSKKDDGIPARDLVFEGRRIDRDQAAELRQKQNIDLSTLEPEANDAYLGNGQTISTDDLAEFPNEGDTLAWDSATTASKRMYRARAIYNGKGDETPFRIVVSTYSHAFLLRAALLRKLGYAVPPMKSYRKLLLNFPTAKAADTFQNEIATQLTFRSSKWITGTQNEGKTLVLQDITLEPGRLEAREYHYGVIPAPAIDGLRSIRALIAPIALTEVPQTPNFFAPEIGRIVSESVAIPYLYANQFQGETTQDDLKWIARRIGKLTRADWSDITVAGDFPADIAALITEKMIARRNQLLELLNLDFAEIPVRLKLSQGFVQNGIATRKAYPGYGLDFTAGEDPEAPLSLPELLRFILIEGISKGIGEVLRLANDKLFTLQSVQDLGTAHQNSIIQKLKDHMAQNPNQPFIEPIQTWGGLFGGIQLQATRNVVTGSYFGGESQVSLVDVFSITANAGYFLSISGMRSATPSATSQLSLTRSYVHVRPLKRVKEGLEYNWLDVFVPKFFFNLSQILKTADGSEAGAKEVTALLEEIKSKELFYINDSVSLGTRLGVNIPLSTLMAIPGVGLGSVNLAAGDTAQLLRRTTFQRTDSGLQVYLQGATLNSIDLSVDATFWIRVARFNKNFKNATASTEAFLLDLSEGSKTDRKRVAASLQPLLAWNNADLLKANFGHFQLAHELDSVSDRFSFLRWQWFNVEENHTVKIRPTQEMVGKQKPEDFERTLYSHKIGENRGSSDYSLLSDLIEGIFPGSGGLTAQSGNNPAETFLGQSVARTVTLETELTDPLQAGAKALVKIERQWQGPEIPAKTLNLILDQIEKQFKTKSQSKLFQRESLALTRSLQFFSINGNLLLYTAALKKIEQTLFPKAGPEALSTWLFEQAGQKRVERWCRLQQANLPVGGEISRLSSIPFYAERKADGSVFRVRCLLPWMKDFMSLRFRDRSTPEKRLATLNWAANLLDKNLSFNQLATLVGTENLYFQVRVSGFRSGDPVGDSDLISSSIGEISESQGGGVFSEFTDRWEILSSELRAQYLNGGF